MGLRPPVALGSSLEEIKEAVITYLDIHGNTPKMKRNKKELSSLGVTWGSVDSRLTRLGTSLYKLCVEMGLRHD